VPNRLLPPPTRRLDPDRLDRAFGVLAEQVRRGDLPAAVLAVAGPDGPIRTEAYAGPDDGPVGTGHRFRVASVTKPIVATAVMQLVEEGRLVLGAPVRTYLPEFQPPPSAPGLPGGEIVSTWHLLTHTSGAADLDWTPLDGVAPSADALLHGVLERPLTFVPGTTYRYASDTFFVLGELVRRLGGWASLGAALQARIFEPLDMTATGFEADVAGHAAAPVHVVGRTDEEAAALGRWFQSVDHPGGGLWSSAADLVAFGRAMLHGGRLGDARILGTPFLELMTREQTAGIFEAGDPPRRPVYGLGWAKSGLDGRMPGSAAQFGHLGATGSRLWIDPPHGLVIALLANLWGADSWPSEAVVAAVYGALEPG
jgi:CubicO group peptidase (beta-lactamase class C family)